MASSMFDGMASSMVHAIASSRDPPMATSMLVVHSAIHGRRHQPTTDGRCDFLARGMGGHGLFHGRAPREQPWSRARCNMNGAIVQSKSMARSISDTKGVHRRCHGTVHGRIFVHDMVHGIVHGRPLLVRGRCHGLESRCHCPWSTPWQRPCTRPWHRPCWMSVLPSMDDGIDHPPMGQATPWHLPWAPMAYSIEEHHGASHGVVGSAP